MGIQLRTIGAASLMWCAVGMAFASPSTNAALENSPQSNDSPAAVTDSPTVRQVPEFESVGNGDSAAPSDDNADYSNCDDGDAGSLCRYYKPSWSITAGVVFLHRSQPGSQPIVVPFAGPGQISAGNDFDFGWGAGPDLTIERRMASGNIWQVRYFADDDSNAPQRDYGVPVSFRLGSNSNFGATDLAGSYDTTLRSAEVNWLHPLNDYCSFLAGGRWIELRDNLAYHAVFPAFDADFHWDENNQLYGAQTGAMFNLSKANNPFKLDAALKAGIYGNAADNGFLRNSSVGGPVPGGGSENDVTFAGEIDVTGDCCISQHIALRAGYQVLWLDGLALASGQAANATATSSEAGIDANSKLLYSGATSAIEFTW